MSSSFSQTLNSITTTKLQVLSKQHSDFTSHKQQVLASVEAANEPREKLRLLIAGIKSWRSTDTTSKEPTSWVAQPTYLDNVEKFLQQAQNDPSIGATSLGEWRKKLTQILETEKVKFEYAELFGRLLTEWIGSTGTQSLGEGSGEKKAQKDGATGTAPKSPSSSQDEFEKIGRKETYKQRAIFESYVFAGKETDTAALEAYLKDLFSLSKDSKNELTHLRKSAKEFGEGLLRCTFTVEDLKLTIKSLMASNLLTNEKRGTLKEFTLNKTVLTEVADVLNMHLSSLSSWTWATDAVPIEMLRSLNGKYRTFMDEEILQAIFLHWLGLKWAVQFKQMFRKIFGSRAWKSSSKQLSKAEGERREYFWGEDPRIYSRESMNLRTSIEQTRRLMQNNNFFMNQLPDDMGTGSAAYDDEDNIGQDREYEKMSPTGIKQSLLHIATTECLLNKMLHNSFTIVRSDFTWFGPSLPHSSIIIVLKFFGVADIWLNFFQKFLSAPLRYVEDGPSAAIQVRKRGVPISHSLSDMFGEVLLFCMDYSVNQRADGLFLYRIHDDFWFWNNDPTVCAKAWKEMSTFASLVGLEFNLDKTGSVCVGQPLHPDLPRGSIKWGFLKLEDSGKFVIDQSQVDIHIAELKLQLEACEGSLFAWVQAYNKYVASFFASNFGSPPAHCFGKQHADMAIETLQRIQLELFPDHQGSVTSYLADAIEKRFGVQDIPTGWFYWPISMGGLEVKSPFIPLYALRDNICIDPAAEFSKLCEQDEETYNLRKEGWDNGTIKKPYTTTKGLAAEPFMPYTEYIQYRPQRLKNWSTCYDRLLDKPCECNVALPSELVAALNSVSVATAELTGKGGISRGGWSQMSVYWRWVVACFGEGMVGKWGGLEVVRPGSLPVGMVDAWKSKRIKWEQ